MCLYPKLITNRKYKPNKKNGGRPPVMKDRRVGMVPVGCQKCMECIKQRGRQWMVRLQEEIRTNKKGQFVTLTFSNESITELKRELKTEGYELDNDIATLATRRFLERWRKKYKKSARHWLVTELGHNGTENVHIHGIIFTEKEQKEDIKKIWKYGFVFIGDYVNERTVNYVIKYTTKIDLMHKEYKPKILTSAGIGNGYTIRYDAKTNRFKKGGKTDESYTTRQGFKMNLPIYYRNKIYSEEERESLWLEKLDKQERWVMGNKISVKNGEKEYYNALKLARAVNMRLGYGNSEKDWDRIEYEAQRRRLMIGKRTKDYENVHERRKGKNSRNTRNETIKHMERLGIT